MACMCSWALPHSGNSLLSQKVPVLERPYCTLSIYEKDMSVLLHSCVSSCATAPPCACAYRVNRSTFSCTTAAADPELETRTRIFASLLTLAGRLPRRLRVL